MNGWRERPEGKADNQGLKIAKGFLPQRKDRKAPPKAPFARPMSLLRAFFILFAAFLSRAFQGKIIVVRGRRRALPLAEGVSSSFSLYPSLGPSPFQFPLRGYGWGGARKPIDEVKQPFLVAPVALVFARRRVFFPV